MSPCRRCVDIFVQNSNMKKFSIISAEQIQISK